MILQIDGNTFDTEYIQCISKIETESNDASSITVHRFTISFSGHIIHISSINEAELIDRRDKVISHWRGQKLITNIN